MILIQVSLLRSEVDFKFKPWRGIRGTTDISQFNMSLPHPWFPFSFLRYTCFLLEYIILSSLLIIWGIQTRQTCVFRVGSHKKFIIDLNIIPFTWKRKPRKEQEKVCVGVASVGVVVSESSGVHECCLVVMAVVVRGCVCVCGCVGVCVCASKSCIRLTLTSLLLSTVSIERKQRRQRT